MTERVGDVRALLQRRPVETRPLLRRLLREPIKLQHFRENGRKGFRFKGKLALDGLIRGEASINVSHGR